MSQLPGLINDLALILVVAALVTVVFKKLKQPLVLGYIVAGFLVSPHMPYVPTVLEKTDIQTWADIGVIFLLFSMGLDFSFKKITKLGLSPFIAVTVIFLTMGAVGFLAGRLFGWTPMEGLFLSAIFSVCSSTTIIYKTFTDLKLKQLGFTNLVLSVLVLEDVLSIVIMVALSAIAAGNGVSGGELLGIVSKIGFFIVLWFVVGIFLIPLLLRRIRRLLTGEILLIISLGLCFFMAVLSSHVGFSSSFGAFVMGAILAETIEGKKVMKVVEPLKDLFGAVFFVSVGMLVDIKIIMEYALPIVAVVVLVIVGQAVFGTFAFVVSGQPLRTSMRCGFSMGQIGEFPFIIASMGLSLGVIGNFMYPVIVAASAITTFLTPYVIKAAPFCYERLEGRLPQTWLERLNRAPLEEDMRHGARQWRSLLTGMARNTLIYSILTVAVIAVVQSFVLPLLHRVLPVLWAQGVAATLGVALVSTFLRAILVMKRLRPTFKELWKADTRNRFPLVVTIVLRTLWVLALVVYMVRWVNVLPLWVAMGLAVVAVLAIVFSKKISRRNSHLEQVFVDNLRSKELEAIVFGERKPDYAGRLLDRNLHVTDVELPETSSWVGKTLAELDLRSRFGVHVSSILRGKMRLNIPYGGTTLYPLDKLQVIGNDEQLTAFDAAMNDELTPDDGNIEEREMKLRHFIVSTDSPFVGKTLEDSGIRNRYHCMVVGLDMGEEHLSVVSPDYVFAPGDMVWVVGEPRALHRLLTVAKLSPDTGSDKGSKK